MCRILFGQSRLEESIEATGESRQVGINNCLTDKCYSQSGFAEPNAFDAMTWCEVEKQARR